MIDLGGATVLVTGASRGIGEATARAFAAVGARVVLVARDAGAVDALARELDGVSTPADLANAAELARLVPTVVEAVGRVDVLVNNAGTGPAGAYWQHEWPEVEALWRVNVLAPVRLCRDVLPGMRERGQGHIVNVSSLAGSGAFPGLTDYSATKAALNMFTAGMRADLRGLPIGTTLAEIGPVPTPLLREAKRYAPADHSFGRFPL